MKQIEVKTDRDGEREEGGKTAVMGYGRLLEVKGREREREEEEGREVEWGVTAAPGNEWGREGVRGREGERQRRRASRRDSERQ